MIIKRLARNWNVSLAWKLLLCKDEFAVCCHSDPKGLKDCSRAREETIETKSFWISRCVAILNAASSPQIVLHCCNPLFGINKQLPILEGILYCASTVWVSLFFPYPSTEMGFFVHVIQFSVFGHWKEIKYVYMRASTKKSRIKKKTWDILKQYEAVETCFAVFSCRR